MRIAFVFLGILWSMAASAQRNPSLAASSWPIYHGSTYATASAWSGPGDVSQVQRVRNQGGFLEKTVSPWTVFPAPYASGAQAVLTTPTAGVAKYLLDGDRFEPVDFLRLDRGLLDFDWTIAVLRDGTALVTERRRNAFVLVGDAYPSPEAPLAVKRRITVDAARYGTLTAHFTVAYDGRAIALTDANRLVAVDLDAGRVLADLALPEGSGVSYHNSFPIDERGRVYLATQQTMVAIDWTGRRFRLAWEAPYDMRGPGCEDVPPKSLREEVVSVARGERCTGTGTTPTLIGSPDSGVVVVVDGHAPRNRLVAFWRGDPPRGWRPVADPTDPGRVLDRRVAGVIELPLSTPEGEGFTAENSPAALGHRIVVAQWAGFRPRRSSPRGVQRVDWEARARRFRLVWANPEAAFNGVPTIACTQGTRCRAYGMGRLGPRYVYQVLDLDTGRETSRLDLGRRAGVLDQGNNHAVADDGSIVYGGQRELVRIR